MEKPTKILKGTPCKEKKVKEKKVLDTIARDREEKQLQTFLLGREKPKSCIGSI